jgi:ABC-2 type transport system ATP-binding protein
MLPLSIRAAQLAVQTRNLSKVYGGKRALAKLTLQVPEGSVFLLIGPNGAGKSTTIKLLLDLIAPSDGHAEVLGIVSDSDGALVRANVGYVPERSDWGHSWMRVGRLLRHHAAFYTNWDVPYANELCRAFALELDQKMSTLSKGQARRVHLVMALAHRPPVLILDEPTDGLDPLMRLDTLGVLRDHLALTPTTVLLSTHHINEIDSLADHVAVMHSGTLHIQASIADVRSSLLRYRARIPAEWSGRPLLERDVIRAHGDGPEIDWTIWGDQNDIAERMLATGATLLEVQPLSLDEAALALLTSARSSI